MPDPVRPVAPREAIEHELKTWPEFFCEVESGAKTFEMRRNDRDFRVGDTLLLREYVIRDGSYTGRSVRRRVTYMLAGPGFGVPAGYVCLAVSPVPWAGSGSGAEEGLTRGATRDYAVVSSPPQRPDGDK